MKKDLISVVIPVYNMEKYLTKCLDSIINQTYKNIEIIVVDDGSTDSSPKMCDDYSKEDKRIKVFHKKNGGLSDAKNYGIKKAKGKYIAFVDSDDWIEINMFEEMYNEMLNTKSDIVICGRYIDYENGKNKKWFNEKKMIMNNKEALIKLNSFSNFDMASWDKLYKKELFENIEFPFQKKCEDAYTTYLLFDKAKKITYIPECLYHYYQRSGSISRDQKINMDFIYAAEEQIDFFKKNHKDIVCVAETNCAFATKSMYQVSVRRNIKLNEEFKDKWKKTRKYKKSVLKNKYIGVKQKMTYLLFSFLPIVYKFLFKIKFFLKNKN